MSRRKAPRLELSNATRASGIAWRRSWIEATKRIDRQIAHGLAVTKEDMDARARMINLIRMMERQFGLKPWNGPTTAEVEGPHQTAQLLKESASRASAAPVNVGALGRPLVLRPSGERRPLRLWLGHVGASYPTFCEAIRAADALAESAGHDIGGALVTGRGQLSTAAPVGHDAYLVFCRKCQRGAWFDPPLSLDPPSIARARIHQLGGVCAAARLPSPPAAAPGQLETHAERGPNRSGSPSTRTKDGPPVGPQR